MKLVLVESPSKAKTIEKYLGKDFKVKATVGHIRDLPKSNKQAIDIEHGFKPHYEVSKNKLEVLAEIKKLAKKADEVFLATDPDREGEAIAWHVAEEAGIKDAERVVFHEITKDAVLEAMKHPRKIDTNLRKAQEARRVLDRLVGYDLSGLIWKKVRYGLSAGRVQSPALRILAVREREIQNFIPEDFWIINAVTETKSGDNITFECSERPTTQEETDRIVTLAKKGSWRVTEVKETNAKRNPSAPFITSTLQQTASSRLGMSPSRAMRTAQKLYEKGLITYMRTDSTTLARVALDAVATVVKKEYGEKYYKAVTYKTKSKVAQEAHEAIRPTDVSKKSAGTTPDEKKLYQLIWSRTVASQMQPAEMLRTKISANISADAIPNFSVNGSRTVFDGWLKADPDARRDDIELPRVSQGEALSLLDIQTEAKQTEPPNRYTEAGLIKELEKRGIGRPSTYAAIIATIQTRGYVEKEARSLKPTDTGMVVSSFLEEHFEHIISDDFTSEMEEDLDDIANGEADYESTLTAFYGPFHKQVDSKADIPKVTNLGPTPIEFVCPKCGGKMVYKLGRSGTFMSCALFPECVGARTKEGEEMKEPESIGRKCPKCSEGELLSRAGRFGNFIACSRYPKCKHIEQDEEQAKKADTGVLCPTCKKGTILERRGRFGLFYSCSDYPDCKVAIKAKPTGRLCTYVRETGICGALMMEGTKTIPERCSDKTCPNHNPHKLVQSEEKKDE
ncbi:MAG: type I DNA topoisomerase [bacterium]|nr:type I DNA topoisomerase [bacterium]